LIIIGYLEQTMPHPEETIPQQDLEQRVLLLGNERRELYGLAYRLEALGWQVTVALTGEQPTKFRALGLHLIVAEIGSPGSATWQVISDLKTANRVPILGFCDLIQPEDLVQGLEAGIQEYIYKPLRIDELDSRMRTLLVRKNNGRPALALVERRSIGVPHEVASEHADRPASRLYIDDNAKVVTLDRKKIRLSRKEYALLRLLASDPGRVFSSQEIVDHLWAGKGAAGSNDAHQYIFLLRKKVEADPRQPEVIKTVAGFGYRLDL